LAEREGLGNNSGKTAATREGGKKGWGGKGKQILPRGIKISRRENARWVNILNLKKKKGYDKKVKQPKMGFFHAQGVKAGTENMIRGKEGCKGKEEPQ